MKEQLQNILDFEKSIIKDYNEEFNNYWDFLCALKKIVITIGKNLDKSKYDEIGLNIWVSKNASIDPSSRIIGPCIIDDDSELRLNTYIRGNVIIGKNCVIGNSCEVKNSILFDNVKIPHFNYIGDSILGHKVHFGAGALTSNIKSDNSIINVTLNDKKHNTDMIKIGAVVGDNVEIGCNAVLTPGVVIGRNCTIYPLTMVRGEIGSNKIVKSMSKIVSKKESKVIYIDFDGTLFDTDQYITDFMVIFNEYSITKATFDEAKNTLFNADNLFNINKLTDYLIHKYNINYELKTKIFNLLDKSYIYPDVSKCLEILISNGYKLYILTYGDKEFQKIKIESSNLSKYFKEIIITEEDKSKLNLDYENSTFIDNNPKEIENFHKSKAKKIIRIRRDTDKYSKIDSNALDVVECKDFNEVVELLKGDFFNE